MKIIKLSLFLGIICIIASAALYFTNSVTAPIIAQNKKEATDKLLKKIVDADEFKTKEVKDGSVINEYTAIKDSKEVFKIYEISTYGFQSQITVLVGIDSNTKKFSGFEVIEQAETPGYGTQITTNDTYISQFKSKSIDDKVDVISGSSVTTTALNKAIDQAVQYYKSGK